MRKVTFVTYAVVMVILLLPTDSAIGEATSPFEDAAALWHMADGRDSSGTSCRLEPHGNVHIGVELEGAQRDASLHRGGDGRVARFEGGYLEAGRMGEPRVRLRGAEMTLCVRLRAPAGKSVWENDGNVPLFGKADKVDKYRRILYAQDGQLHYVWRTEPAERRIVEKSPKGEGIDFVDGVLRLKVPVVMIGPARWHDVVTRFRGPNLELFVDGVLVDEEWPHGSLVSFHSPFLIGADWREGQIQSGFRGLIDHVALWDRALSDEEISTLSGGKKEVARRDVEILGLRNASMQYWRPRGHNTSAGDCMCLFHDGTFHLFYLFDRRNHNSKWDLGAHQYAHVSTKDLVHWTHHPLAVPINHPWECSMGTGEFIYHDGKYYAFSTDCGSRCQFVDKPHQGSGIFMSTSVDGTHFVKQPADRPIPVVPGGDCTVFRDDRTGWFHLLTPGPDGLTDYMSIDLANWRKQKKPIIGSAGACPHHFRWNNWYYLTMDGLFWKSNNPTGPWTQLEPAVVTWLALPKTAPFTGNRRIAVGWIGDRNWGGNIVLLEMVQRADGSLGTKFLLEMIPASGEPMDLALRPLTGEISGNDKRLGVQMDQGFGCAMMSGVPQDARITVTVHPQPGVTGFGLCLRGSGRYEQGVELQFQPSNGRVQFGKPNKGGLGSRSSDLAGGWNGWNWSAPAIQAVSCLDRSFALDIIAIGSIVHVEIDDQRTIITRRKDCEGDRIFFFVQGGEVAFEDIQVRPLK